MFGQDAVAFYLLSERVSREIKVVQSGQGADEVFGGYFWYPRMLAEGTAAGSTVSGRHYFDRDDDEAAAHGGARLPRRRSHGRVRRGAAGPRPAPTAFSMRS